MPHTKTTAINSAQFQQSLLKWYTHSHRPMPWRQEDSSTPNPYFIWLAEIMLQQTTVAAVIPYYHRFLARFPTVESLANASIEDILHLWQGLGYYRRAHMLHRCAQVVANQYNSQFPNTEEELLKLPGLGPYTASVMMATAFNQPATVVDGNVERVITRLYRIQQALPASKPTIKYHAAQLASNQYPRLYANAIMELGSQVCTPKNPQCLLCPVAEFCQANTARDQALYPFKTAKKAIPHHHGTAYLISNAKGEVYLRQRPNTGLLSSLWELPHTGWENTPLPQFAITEAQPAGHITHVFTHFKLTLNLARIQKEDIPSAHRFTLENLPPLSTLMRKALTHALKN